MDVDIAQWIRDEILSQITYSGVPTELGVLLARHERALEQLAAIITTERFADDAPADDTPDD